MPKHILHILMRLREAWRGISPILGSISPVSQYENLSSLTKVDQRTAAALGLLKFRACSASLHIPELLAPLKDTPLCDGCPSKVTSLQITV